MDMLLLQLQAKECNSTSLQAKYHLRTHGEQSQESEMIEAAWPLCGNASCARLQVGRMDGQVLPA